MAALPRAVSGFQPMTLLDFDGLVSERESEFSRPNSWQQLDNAYVKRGRLRKRPSATYKQKLGVEITEQIGLAGSTTYSGFSLTNKDWLPPARGASATDYNIHITADWSGGSMDIVVDPASGVVLADKTITYTLVDVGTTTFRGAISWHTEAVTAQINVTFPNTTTTNPQVTYEYSEGEPVMGFKTFVDGDGSEHNLAFSTKRAWLLNNTEERYYEINLGATPQWTGGDTDHFWCEGFDDILVINNGQDEPRKYDPSATPKIQIMGTDFNPSIVGDDIDSAKMFWNYLGYGVYLATVENGATRNGRVRWTQNGNPEAFNSADDYLDAPQNDIFITSGMVAGELYVGFRDTGWWKFEFTGDTLSPFRWHPIESYHGAVARHGTVSFSDHLMSRTRRGFVDVSRMGERETAQELGEEPLDWSPQAAYLTQSLRADELRQAWWTVADGTAVAPDKVLVMQQEQDGDDQFSLWDFSFTSIGTYRSSGIPTIDELSDRIDESPWIIDSLVNLGGFPRVVAGDSTGLVREFKGSAEDSTSPYQWAEFTNSSVPDVDMLARSIRLSPVPGQRTRLGFVDILADASDGAELTFRMYADNESSTYAEYTVDLSGGADTKVVRRVPINRIALFHTLEIVESSKADLQIDYLALWFKPAGRVRET